MLLEERSEVPEELLVWEEDGNHEEEEVPTLREERIT